MEKLREEVITNIRALLITFKGSCDIQQLREDYKMIMGTDIPYNRLGFKNLEMFFESIPTLRTTRNCYGQIIVDAVVGQKSQHIKAMVNKQKGKKKTRLPTRRTRSTFYTHQQPVSNWRPRNVNNRWRTNYHSSPGPTAVSHNQFVNIPAVPKKSTVSQRLVPQQPAPKISEGTQTVVNQEAPPQTPTQTKTTNGEKCTALMNTKMRLTKRISDISLDQDGSDMCGVQNPVKVSGNIGRGRGHMSSGVIRNPGASLEQLPPVAASTVHLKSNGTPLQNKSSENLTFSLTGDNIADLYSFTASRNLDEPVFKVLKRKTKLQRRLLYDCQIKVGTHSFSSYPVDFSDENLAKDAAAKKALDELIPKYGKRRSLLLSNENDVLERIPPIVQKHYHGIWSWQLEADYADMFQEQLPVNWLEIVDMIPCIVVSPCMDSIVLQYCQPGEKGTKPFMPPSFNVSVASNTVKFDEDGVLMAEITCIVSAGEIWCRQLNTPEADAFVNMVRQLEEFYSSFLRYSDATESPVLEVGGYYAALYENSWVRVRILDISGDDVSCFCIDYGDECIIPKRYIYVMRREFAKEQAQAFVCRLAGLEELYEASYSSEHLANLVTKTFQLQLENNSEELPKSSPDDPIFSVVLYDPETGDIVNKKLISLISMEAATPTLSKDTSVKVLVSHAEPTGVVFVQVHSPGYVQLLELMEELETSITQNTLDIRVSPITSENSVNRLYLTKNKDNNRWYRAKILDWSPDKKYAQISFVDYGYTDIINVQSEAMYPLDELSDVISQFPHQALLVRMVLDSVPDDFVNIVKTIMPADQPVLVKVIDTDKDNIYWVEFFKRTEPDNVLFSVNKAMSLETEFRFSSGDGNNNAGPLKSTKLQRLISLNQFDDATLSKNVPSSGSLKCPPLPKIGNYFDVKVQCAVNPWNFFVQPHSSQDKLKQLMIDLQERYKDMQFSPLRIEDVKPGHIYASRYDDGMWYRTSVIKVIHPGSISVFYCDYGYYANLTLKQLVPLDVGFVDLPYQAIKAKLYGIKPKENKWSMEDCKFFERLVCKKAFVSILVSIEKDELYRCDTVLNLRLVDTSEDEDIHIEQVLIDKAIAAAI